MVFRAKGGQLWGRKMMMIGEGGELCDVFTSALQFAGLSVMCCLGDSAEAVIWHVSVSAGNSLAHVLSGQRVVSFVSQSRSGREKDYKMCKVSLQGCWWCLGDGQLHSLGMLVFLLGNSLANGLYV